MSDIFKKIKISWTYPTQPTSLQIGTVKIYRGTSEFTLDNVLSQVEIVSQEYDPTFTSFTDDFELEYDVTYYYMIIVYGDIDSSISAATALYSLKIETPVQTPTISCEGATPEAVLTGYNVMGMSPPPTVDVYVQNILISENVDATWINQRWFEDQALMDNADLLSYSVYGTSSGLEVFSTYGNSESINSESIAFRLVPKTDGFYDGQVYSAKDALQIHYSNSNPTVYKDPVTGVVTFCVGGTI